MKSGTPRGLEECQLVRKEVAEKNTQPAPLEQQHVSKVLITTGLRSPRQLELPTILLIPTRSFSILTSARFSISHLFRIFMAKTLSVLLTFTTAT